MANEVVSIHGIINGTTNYILTKMAQKVRTSGVALAAAQELGYAESDPTNDVEGIDAAYKLAILSTLAFRARVSDADVYSEGITHLTGRTSATQVSLVTPSSCSPSQARQNGAVHVRVHPAMVRSDVMLAKVDGVLNAIEVQTDLAGRVLFHGRGAGDMAHDQCSPRRCDGHSTQHSQRNRSPASAISHSRCAYKPHQRAGDEILHAPDVAERPGVFAQILKVLGDLDISIASAIQKETDDAARRAEIVLMTHRAKEASCNPRSKPSASSTLSTKSAASSASKSGTS